jgi:hypothetical protein
LNSEWPHGVSIAILTNPCLITGSAIESRSAELGQFRSRSHLVSGRLGTMTVNIGENVKAYLGAHAPDARYASFDYCFNYFQEAREAGNAACLAGDEHLQLSCLQLGFYLASWGMMRESSGLLQRSVRRLRLLPVVEQIAKEEGRIWELDVDDYAEQADEVLGPMPVS